MTVILPQLTGGPPTASATRPHLTVTRTAGTNKGVSRGDEIKWTLNFSNSPRGVIFDERENEFNLSDQFEARAVNEAGEIINEIASVPVELTQVTANAQYIATGTILVTNPDETINYALFPRKDLSGVIENDAGGLRFNNLPLSSPNTNLINDEADLYDNIPPTIPIISIVRASPQISVIPPRRLIWNLSFSDLGNSNPSPISLASPSPQFGVCYDDRNNTTSDDVLPLTITQVVSNLRYVATSTPITSLINEFNYHVCALDGVAAIQSPSFGTLAVNHSGIITQIESGMQITRDTDLTFYRNIPPLPPKLTVNRTNINAARGVRVGSTISWDLNFTGDPLGIRTSGQFVAKASGGGISDIPLTVAPHETIQGRYIATAIITEPSDDTSITYSIFPTADLSSRGGPFRIFSVAGGVEFEIGRDEVPLSDPNTNLSAFGINQYTNLAPTIPTLAIAQDTSDPRANDPASAITNDFLAWTFTFVGIQPDAIDTDTVSTQFQVCYPNGRPLPLTLVEANGTLTYTARTDAIPLRSGVFNFNVCTHENFAPILSPSKGVLTLQGSTNPITTDGLILTTQANDYSNTPPVAPRFGAVARLPSTAETELTAIGEVSWTVAFNSDVDRVDTGDFTVTNGDITRVVVATDPSILGTPADPLSGRVFAVTANITQPSGNNGKTVIHLTRAEGSDIETTLNGIRFPPTGSQQLTDISADNHYILSTDETPPTIADENSITRVSSGGVSASDQRITFATTVRWRVQFTENVYGVSTDDFGIILDSDSPVAPTDVEFTENTDFAIISYEVTSATETDMLVNLELADNVTITDSLVANGNQNAFATPSFGTRLTNANTQYIFNTDISLPVLSDLDVNPLSSPTEITNAGETVEWEVVFTENVLDVDPEDFEYIIGDITPSNQPIPLTRPVVGTPGGDTYRVSVTIPSVSYTNQRLHLRLANFPSIVDANGNRNLMADYRGQVTNFDTSYLLNITNVANAPTVTLDDNDQRVTGAQVSWLVTFEQPVSGLSTASNFGVSIGSSINQDVTVAEITTNRVVRVTYNITSTQTTDTDVHLSIRDPNTIRGTVTDAPVTAGQITDAATRFIYNTDTTGPSIRARTNVVRLDGDSTGRVKAVGEIRWNVTFDGPVFDVGINDFALAGITGSITDVTVVFGAGIAPNTYTVTANTTGVHDSDAFVQLDIASGVTIFDSIAAAGNRNGFKNPIFGDRLTDATNQYIINTDASIPTIDGVDRISAENQTVENATVEWQVRFTENVVDVGPDDFEFQIIETDGTASVPLPVNSVTGSGNTYRVFVTVPGSLHLGSNLHLRLVDNPSITDAGGNANPIPKNIGQITDDNSRFILTIGELIIAPTIAIVGNQRRTFGTVAWEITFTEDVTNLTADQFSVSVNDGAAQPVTISAVTSNSAMVSYTLSGTTIGDFDVHLSIRDTNSIGYTDPNLNHAIGQITDDTTKFIYNTDLTGASITAFANTVRLDHVDDGRIKESFDTVRWDVTFDGEVHGVGINDFNIIVGTASAIPPTSVEPSATPNVADNTFTVTVNVTGTTRLDRIVHLELVSTPTILDSTADNGNQNVFENPSFGARLTNNDNQYILNTDITPPTVDRVEIRSVRNVSVPGTAVIWRVHFDEDVESVGPENFEYKIGTDAAITVTNDVTEVTKRQYDVSVTIPATTYDDERLHLGVVASPTITDAGGNTNPLAKNIGLITTDADNNFYILNIQNRPTVVAETTPQQVINGNVTWLITFIEAVSGLDNPNNFGVSIDGGAFQDVTVAALNSSSVRVTYALPGNQESNVDIHLWIRSGHNIGATTNNAPSSGQITDDTTRYIYNSDDDPPTIDEFANVKRLINVLNGRLTASTNVISWDVTFNEPVVDVGTNDFQVRVDTDTGVPPTDVALSANTNAPANTYTITTTVTRDTNNDIDIHLELADTVTIFDSTAADGNRNAFVASFGTRLTNDDSKYIVNTDNTPPSIVDVIRTSNQNANTAGNTVAWRVIFDDTVLGVDEADFQYQIGDSPPVQVTRVTGGGDSYFVNVVIPGRTINNQELHLRVSTTATITDAGNNRNPLPTNLGQITDVNDNDPTTEENYYILDIDGIVNAPTVTFEGTTQRVTADKTISWLVAFDEPVNNLIPGNFRVSVDGAPDTNASNVGIIAVSSPNAVRVTYAVDVSAHGSPTSDANIELSIPRSSTIDNVHGDKPVPATITDSSNRFILNTDITGPSIAGAGNIVRLDGDNGRVKRSGGIRWDITFDQPVFDIDKDDFALSGIAGNISTVVENNTATFANTYTVTANVTATPRTDTTVHLALAGTVTITDSTADNGNQNAFITPSFASGASGDILTDASNVYIINTDTTNPTITSVLRNTPTNREITVAGSTIIWQLLFNENVTGVGLDDFEYKIGDNPAAPITRISGGTGPLGSNAVLVTIEIPSIAYTNEIIHLRVVDSPTITDASGNANPLALPSFATGNQLTNSNTAYELNITGVPTVTRDQNASQRVSSGTVTWLVKFDETVTNLIPSNFRVSVDGVVDDNNISVTGVLGDEVRVSYILSGARDSDADIHLIIPDGNTITTDPAGNPTPDGQITDESTKYIYNPDTTGPSISAFTDIVRNDALDGDSNVVDVDGRIKTSPIVVSWDVTFDQAVFSIDTNDFRIVVGNATGFAPTSVEPNTDFGARDHTYTITANIPNTTNRDRTINLDLSETVTIEDSTVNSGNQNTFVKPSFITTGNRLTNEATRYTLNTDNEDPAISFVIPFNNQSVTTPGATVRWQVQFTDNVRGVDPGDFQYQIGSAAPVAVTNPITDEATGTEFTEGFNSYYVSVTIPSQTYTNQRLHLRMVDNPTIIDAGGNANEFPDDVGQITDASSSYLLNITGAPTVTRDQNAVERVKAPSTVTWLVRFPNDVTGHAAGQFSVSVDGVVDNTNISVDDITRNSVEVSYVLSGDQGTDADVHLSIRDPNSIVGNLIVGQITDETSKYIYNTDTDGPSIAAFSSTTRLDAIRIKTSPSVIRWDVTFDEPVVEVDVDDFRIRIGFGTRFAPTSVEPSVTPNAPDNTYTVTATATGTNDTDQPVHLDLATTVTIFDSTADDGNRNPFATPGIGTRLTDATTDENTTNRYILNTDITPPAIADNGVSTVGAESVSTPGRTVQWAVRFTENVEGLNPEDFEYTIGSNPAVALTNPITDTQTGSTFTEGRNTYFVSVTLPIVTYTNERLHLRMADSPSIFDAGGNKNQFRTNVGQISDDASSFLLNIVGAPTVSLEGANQRATVPGTTITWLVTFGENVTGITTNEFRVTVGSGSPQNVNTIDSTDITSNSVMVRYTLSGIHNSDTDVHLFIRSGNQIRGLAGNSAPAGQITDDITKYIYNTDLTGASIANRSNIVRNNARDTGGTIVDVDGRIKVSSSVVSWDVTFDGPVFGVGIDDFRIRVGLGNRFPPTSVALNTNSGAPDYTYTVTATATAPATAPGAPIVDAAVSLAIDSNVTITDSTADTGNQNPFKEPSFSNLLTNDTNQYVLNTDITPPAILANGVNITGPVNVSVPGANVEWSIAFNEPVAGLNPADFQYLIGDSSPSNRPVAVTNPISNTTGGTTYTDGQTTYFVSVTIPNAIYDNERIHLLLPNTVTITDFGGNQNPLPKNLGQITDNDSSYLLNITGRPVATIPTVSGVTLTGGVNTIGGSAQQRVWNVTFNQLTTNVSDADFEIVNATGTVISGASIISVSPDTSNGTDESATYAITIQLPTSGHPTATSVRLRTKSTHDIEGAEGAVFAGSSDLERKPFAAGENLITTEASHYFSLQSLSLSGVTLAIFNHPTSGTALTVGTATNAPSRPARAEWTVTYSTSPETGLATPLTQTERNALFDFTCASPITGTQCNAIIHSVALSGNEYIITVRDTIPNPTTEARAELTLTSAATINANLASQNC